MRTEGHVPSVWRGARSKIIAEQRRDPESQRKIQKDPTAIQSERDGLVYLRQDNMWKIHVPEPCTAQTVQLCHEWLFGRNKLYSYIRERMIVKGLDRLCRTIGESCELCQRSKWYSHRTEGRWHIEVPDGPNHVVALDIFGSLPLASDDPICIGSDEQVLKTRHI